MSGPVDPGPLAVLGRLRRRPPPPRAGERCELCGEEIGDEHRHLVDLSERSLKCTCRACTLLFDTRGAAGGRFRAVPDRYLAVEGFDAAGGLDALDIPVGMVFVIGSSDGGEVTAFYPGPAGATESLLPLGTWEAVLANNPVLAELEPDVEAALIRAEHASDLRAAECFIVPVDACYELVGLLRRLWRGFDGGAEARTELSRFFENIRRRAGVAPLARPSLPSLGEPRG